MCQEVLLLRGWIEQRYPRFCGIWAYLSLSGLELDEFFTDSGGTPLRGSSQSFLVTLHQELPDLAQIGRNNTRGRGTGKSSPTIPLTLL